MKGAVILGACRTAGGSFGGSLKALEAVDLGAAVIREAVKRAGIDPAHVGELVMGNGWQAGNGPNPARIAGWRSEALKDVPAFTVNMRCGSGLLAVALGADKVRLGSADAVVSGGMESASRVPYILPDARWGHTMGEKAVPDLLHRDGFQCPLSGMLMGRTAEILASEYGISREEQDAYSAESHRRAVEAIDGGAFKKEILPVEVRVKKETILFDTDEIPRRDTGIDKLARLPSIFMENGTVTAGSSSALCDAGSAVVVAGSEWAGAEGLAPLAEILSYSLATVPPDHMGMGPVPAIKNALDQAGLSLGDIDLFEINEAFAVQVLAVQRELRFPLDRCNIHGGAIALGHPIGATGAKILTTLLHSLEERGKEIGCAAACIGGGQGVAMIVRRL
mgnify:FL=1